MNVPERPRTWILVEHKAFHGIEAEGETLAQDIDDENIVPVEVIEKAPIKIAIEDAASDASLCDNAEKLEALTMRLLNIAELL